jgi:hypothetical protein
LQAEDAMRRVMKKVLDKLDPEAVWGGLKAETTPEGYVLVMCKEHREEYNRNVSKLTDIRLLDKSARSEDSGL